MGLLRAGLRGAWTAVTWLWAQSFGRLSPATKGRVLAGVLMPSLLATLWFVTSPKTRHEWEVRTCKRINGGDDRSCWYRRMYRHYYAPYQGVGSCRIHTSQSRDDDPDIPLGVEAIRLGDRRERDTWIHEILYTTGPKAWQLGRSDYRWDECTETRRHEFALRARAVAAAESMPVEVP